MIRFYLTVFLIVFFAAPLWAASSTPLKNSKSKIPSNVKKEPPKKINYPLKDNFNLEQVLGIFNQHGLALPFFTKIYETADQTSSITHGHAVCRGLFLKHFRNMELMEVKPTSINLSSNKYKYGEKIKGNDKEILLRGSACYYGSKKDDYFFICSGRNNFYYIFRVKTNKLESKEDEDEHELFGCTQIIKKKEYYPKIEIRETTNIIDADSIFANFKPVPAENKNHVCSVGNMAKNKPEIVCYNIMKRQEGDNVVNNISHNCETKKIHRFVVKKKSNINDNPLDYEEGPQVRGINCVYKKQEGSKPTNLKWVKREVVIFDAPKTNFFYVASHVNNDNKWIVSSVIEVK